MRNMVEQFKQIEKKIQKNSILLLIFCFIVLVGLLIIHHLLPKKGVNFIYEQF